jgi:hypothetical protein
MVARWFRLERPRFRPERPGLAAHDHPFGLPPWRARYAARCPVRAAPTPVAESCSLPPSTQSLNFSSPSHGFFAKIRVEMSYRCRDVDYVKKPVRRTCEVEIWGSSQGRRVR